MADLNKKYQIILNELTQRIQDKSELEFIKEKMNELVIEYMSSIDKILEIEKNQMKLENKVQKIQNELSMIEEDIYVNDDDEDDEYIGGQINDCEFEITCPYCGYEFLTDESYKSETEIKCPQCQEIIELDWKEEKCSGDCHACNSKLYSSSSENESANHIVTVEESAEDANNNQPTIEQSNNQSVDYNKDNVNQILQNKENKNNNEDDM